MSAHLELKGQTHKKNEISCNTEILIIPMQHKTFPK